ncbi:DcrB-related protein [Pseudomonas sp. NPDC089406]|uniref:DcrB-related protein n=1 Tax=Pseudomonas sp. NPDC089406 TaxID=3364463 RepID=UPI00385161B5
MAAYLTHDLTLELGDETPEDTSMNMLAFRERGTSLVIARSALPPGQTLEDLYQQQLAQLRERLGAVISEPHATVTGAAGDIMGLEVSLQFKRGEVLSYQRQLAYTPPGQARFVVMSYCKPSPLADDDLAHWQAIKANLRLN